MYCPKCGRQNEDRLNYCRACGENLKTISKAMGRRWPKLLTSLLDRYIRYKDRNLAKAGRRLKLWIIGGSIWLCLGIAGKIKGDPDWWFDLLLGLFYLVIGTWDYTTYQRRLASDSNQSKLTPSAEHRATTLAAAITDQIGVAELASSLTTEKLEPSGQRRAEPPSSVTEATTRQLDPPIKRAERNRE